MIELSSDIALFSDVPRELFEGCVSVMVVERQFSLEIDVGK